MKVCDESLYHEIAVIYRFLHLYERMETEKRTKKAV